MARANLLQWCAKSDFIDVNSHVLVRRFLITLSKMKSIDMTIGNLLRLSRCVLLFGVCLAFVLGGCTESEDSGQQLRHADVAFVQDHAVKYNVQDSIKLLRVASDRNGVIQISTSGNLYKPHAGEFLFPGSLVRERYYRPAADKKVAGVVSYKDHLVYVDDKAVLSNAWAGNLFVRHSMPGASMLAGGKDFDFLISDGQRLPVPPGFNSGLGDGAWPKHSDTRRDF